VLSRTSGNWDNPQDLGYLLILLSRWSIPLTLINTILLLQQVQFLCGDDVLQHYTHVLTCAWRGC